MPRLFNVDEIVTNTNDIETNDIETNNEEGFITKEDFIRLKNDVDKLKRSNNIQDNGDVINTNVVPFVRKPELIFSDKEGMVKQLTDYYWQEELFTLQECIAIRELAKSLSFSYGQTEGSEGEKPASDIRNNFISWLPLNDTSLWIYQRISDLIISANKETWQFSLTGFYEDIQYSIYQDSIEDEQSHYNWHLDIGSQDPMYFRKISVSIQMSEEDDYEGGELQLQNGHEAIIATKSVGSVLVFPSYMLHRVTPITRGKRESVQIWISGVPFQ